MRGVFQQELTKKTKTQDGEEVFDLGHSGQAGWGMHSGALWWFAEKGLAIGGGIRNFLTFSWKRA
jgi:hypothetical protein